MTVVFDAVGPSGGAGIAFTASPGTWTHVNGGNGIVVGVTIFNGGSNTVTGVTYGGVTVPFLVFVPSDNGTVGGVALYGLVGGTCPTGSNTVSVAFSDGGSNHNAGSISVSGAGSLGTAVSNFASANTVSVTVNGTTTGGLIVSTVCQGSSGNFSATSPNVLRWTILTSAGSGADNGAGGTDPSTGGGANQSVTWTNANVDFWGIVAVEVLPPTGGGAGVPATAYRPSKSRLYHHHGARRQQIQAVFATPASAANPTAGLATATATAVGSAAALGTVTGFTSLPGDAVAGLFTPGAPEFPSLAVTAQLATARVIAWPTAFDYANAGLATAAVGAPLNGTYTALYTDLYGQQLTTVSTVPLTNAPAGLASATAIAQQTAGHNAGFATGTGSAAPTGMAQSQLASATGIAQQTAGHNTTAATGTGTAQQTAGHNTQAATVSGSAPSSDMGAAQVATATGAAQQTAGHNAQLATATGSAQQTAGHNAQNSTVLAVALQATVSTITGPKKAIGVTVAATRITGIGNGKNTSTISTVQSSATGFKLVVTSGTNATPVPAQTVSSGPALLTMQRNAADIKTTDTSGSLNAAGTTGEGGP